MGDLLEDLRLDEDLRLQQREVHPLAGELAACDVVQPRSDLAKLTGERLEALEVESEQPLRCPLRALAIPASG
ncbi:MAG TPA: hypothetical protein VM324_16185 [Egibacteraceae bacterium]|nr:hypothetical protein [Egibacteraceae bacterium]